MEKRRTPLPLIILFLITFLFAFANIFELPSYLIFALLIILVTIILIASTRQRPQRPRGIPPEFEEKEIPFRPPRGPRIGKWIIIPIAFGAVIGFILFENWWLTVRILQSMYSTKAEIDWWKINFLDNYYFYACIAIGLLIALSDPRIVITKDEEGKRRIYLHSKFWGVINAIFTQMYRYGGEFRVPTGMREGAWDDRISLKRGIVWKLLEFLVGALLIGPYVAKDLAFGYLLIAKWIETQQISWISFLQRCFSVLSTRLFTSEMPTGAWLIENSPILEFLTWIRTPIIIFGIIWAIRLIASFVFELLRGNIASSLRAITLIGLIILTPFLLQVPTQVFDITTPFYIRTMVIGEIILITLAVFFSLKMIWVQRGVGILYRRKIYLAMLIILVLGSLSVGPIVVAFQYSPAMQGHWKDWVWQPKYLPTVEYTRWATGLESIKEARVTAAMDTGENLEILSRIRVFSDAAAKLRFMPRIGVNWMDLGKQPDIIWSGGKEYWLAPLTIVQPPVGSTEDQWRAQRMLITHSERILTLDAASGDIIPISSVFNITGPVSMYYGEGGLFASSDMVYIGIPGFPETHLPEYVGPLSYTGEPDYVLTGLDRTWFFSGIYGQEMLRWDFGRGDYGDIKMLYLRDINKRLSSLLLPGMTIDEDPYIVCDPKGNVYYSLYIYVDRDMPTEYLDYPAHEDKFWRVFATILINTYDGSISGYLFKPDDKNYIMDFYRSMYPQWDQSIPKWLESQLRYPEFLFEKQIDSYNWYHVSNPDNWQKNTDFFELTTDANRNVIEDVRYVTFSLNKTDYWAAVRLVEWYQSPGQNLAGLYVALNGENIGNVFLIRSENVAVAGPQTALGTVNNYGSTKALLTLNPNWVSGNILLYVIRGTPYYFIPYYARAENTLSPAMVVTVDALSQRVGYYVIKDPTDASEVGSSPAKAYSNLIGLKIELTAEARRDKITNEFTQLGYTTKTPQQLNPNIAYQEGSSSYYKDEDWNNTRSLVSTFINTWAVPNKVNTILQWETTEGSVRYVNLGILISQNGVVELHYIKIAYSSG